jgi:4'-phosphopantetheinyl transferase
MTDEESNAAPEWTEPAAFPTLRAGAVHVWLADLGKLLPHRERIAGALAREERERAARFRFDQHRRRFELTRGTLRALLARYTGIPADQIAFSYNVHGKPLLEPAAGRPSLHFNTSHSGDFAVFAFTNAGRVGVDIEQVRTGNERWLEIARRFFAPGEADRLESWPEHERALGFFTCWTRKEAFVKARGDGIFAGLSSFEVTAAHGEGARLVRVDGDPDAPNRWWLRSIAAIPGYAAAVAVEANDCELLCFAHSSAAAIG